jgi:hypothetical protein
MFNLNIPLLGYWLVGAFILLSAPMPAVNQVVSQTQPKRFCCRIGQCVQLSLLNRIHFHFNQARAIFLEKGSTCLYNSFKRNIEH